MSGVCMSQAHGTQVAREDLNITFYIRATQCSAPPVALFFGVYTVLMIELKNKYNCIMNMHEHWCWLLAGIGAFEMQI
jgi:hypothetical protein